MIDVKPEPETIGRPYEDCVFCREETRFWSVKQDVPVCPRCAYQYTEDSVPSKLDWIRKIVYLEDFLP